MRVLTNYVASTTPTHVLTTIDHPCLAFLHEFVSCLLTRIRKYSNPGLASLHESVSKPPIRLLKLQFLMPLLLLLRLRKL